MGYFERGADMRQFDEVFLWLRGAAEGGHAHAQYLLAMMYWEGWGTGKDPAEAHRWVLAAQANGVVDNLGLVPRIERGLHQRREKPKG
jgi:hypothetical protein